MKKIAILGAGSWGTALALHFARCDMQVRLWSNDRAQIESIQRTRCNSAYLPHAFPNNLQAVIALAEAIQDATYILIAVPSGAFRSVAQSLQPLLDAHTGIIWASKGLDPNTGQCLHEIAIEILGKTRPYAVLSGPTFAREIAQGLPAAVALASHPADYAISLAAELNHAHLRIQACADMMGTQMGGVIKNVIAIAAGINDGLQLGANARSALLTNGLTEMISLGTAMGGKHDTFMGLSGLGDLILTATDDQSRNRRFGLAIGRGEDSQQAETAISQVVEGKHNVAQVIALAQRYDIHMPIVAMVFAVLNGEVTPRQGMQQLLENKMHAVVTAKQIVS